VIENRRIKTFTKHQFGLLDERFKAWGIWAASRDVAGKFLEERTTMLAQSRAQTWNKSFCCRINRLLRSGRTGRQWSDSYRHTCKYMLTTLLHIPSAIYYIWLSLIQVVRSTCSLSVFCYFLARLLSSARSTVYRTKNQPHQTSMCDGGRI
jgi:hypothetical protein